MLVKGCTFFMCSACAAHVQLTSRKHLRKNISLTGETYAPLGMYSAYKTASLQNRRKTIASLHCIACIAYYRSTTDRKVSGISARGMGILRGKGRKERSKLGWLAKVEEGGEQAAI